MTWNSFCCVCNIRCKPKISSISADGIYVNNRQTRDHRQNPPPPPSVGWDNTFWGWMLVGNIVFVQWPSCKVWLAIWRLFQYPKNAVSTDLHTVPDSKVHGPTVGPSGSCQPQKGPMLAPWTLLSGTMLCHALWNVTGEIQCYPITLSWRIFGFV